MFVEGHLGGGAEIQIPVEAVGHFAVGHGASGLEGVIGVIPDTDVADLAELAGLEEILDFAKVLGGAVLGADVDHPLVSSSGAEHGLAFTDVVGEGLFDVDILAGLAGEDRRDGVPVVRRGDVNGVDLFFLEDAAEILMDLGGGGEGGFGAVGVGEISVGEGGVFGAGLLGDEAGDIAAAATTTDEREANPLIGAEDTAGGQRGERQEGSSAHIVCIL